MLSQADINGNEAWTKGASEKSSKKARQEWAKNNVSSPYFRKWFGDWEPEFARTYNSTKGVEAIVNTLSNRLDIQKAFYRPELGYINLRWGDEEGGLYHILTKRAEVDGIDAEAFVRRIPEIISEGSIRTDTNRRDVRYAIEYAGARVIISTDYSGNLEKWIISGYELFNKNTPDVIDGFNQRGDPTHQKATVFSSSDGSEGNNNIA